MINIEAIFDIPCANNPVIPNKIIMIPMIQNWNPKRNDNASIWNMNNKPNMIARIPTMTLNAENPPNIDAIPKTTKLTPIMMDTNPELRIGKIKKINPKTMDSNPDDLLASMFFPPFCYVHSLVKLLIIQKQQLCFHKYNLFLTIINFWL